VSPGIRQQARSDDDVIAPVAEIDRNRISNHDTTPATADSPVNSSKALIKRLTV
jgi:hypothetical protein